jgi:hypothetical protein
MLASFKILHNYYTKLPSTLHIIGAVIHPMANYLMGLVPRQDVTNFNLQYFSAFKCPQTNPATDAELFLKSNYHDICHPYRANLCDTEERRFYKCS